MSVKTSMYNNQINSPFQAGHIRSESFSKMLTNFRQSMNSPIPIDARIRTKKRTFDKLDSDSTDKIEDHDPKRSRTAPPQSPSPNLKSEHTERHSRNYSDVVTSFDKTNIARPRSLSPSKTETVSSPSASPKVDNSSVPSQPEKTKSSITLPSFSTVLRENVKTVAPTTSLDYFDTYKPNDENWRYGLLDTMKSSKNYNLGNYTVSNSNTRPVFDSKISRPTLPKIDFEPKRKINFPYESNYTYLNKTYLNDVERYPEYLELAHSLIQLSHPSAVPTLAPIQVPPSRVKPNFPPLYPHQVQEHHYYQPPHPQQPASLQSHHQNHHQQQNSYPAFMTSPSATVMNIPPYNYVPEQPRTPPKKHTKFIPITPPSSKANNKIKNDSLKSPTKSNHPPRVCISCGLDQSPCWRPSWSSKEGQLCNSCGLRYKKTSARCLNKNCKKIPAKGEWSLMQTKGKTTFEDGKEAYACLDCGNEVEVNN